MAVLPTGGGKTLVYQMAGTLLDGTTVIATPLIALMQDQVRRLTDEPGARPGRVESINGSIRGAQREQLLSELAGNRIDFMFCTPEQLARDDLRKALRKADVSLFVIDEAHCISEWGFDFRPAYRELAEAADAMGRPPILALTATAPEAVRRDVANELHLKDAALIARGCDRSNLSFGVVRVTDPDRRDRQLAKLISDLLPNLRNPASDEVAVVYCTTRREAQDTAFALLELGLPAGHYHGGMERGLREEVQSSFISEDLRVLCATSAFGMGIDKANIRAVIHRTMPDSLEAYWQEAGRAGRDGFASDCVLMYRPEDRSIHEHLHRRSRPSETSVAKVVHLLSKVTRSRNETKVIAEIADAATVARSGIQALVEDLDRFGYVKRSGENLRFAGDPAVAMEELAAHQAIQVEVESSRLDMVASYAEATTCRRRYLLNYLGDDYPAELCLRCDNCLRVAQRRNTEDWDIDLERERVEADRGGPFSTGQTVRHPEWGDGAVQRVDGDTLVVRFESVGYRSMHAPTVIERRLLEPA